MSPSETVLASQVADLLWLSRRQMADVLKGPKARQAHRDFIFKRYAQMLKDGLSPELLLDGEKLRAALLHDKNFSRWVGARNHQSVTLALDMNDREARTWIVRRIANLLRANPHKKFRVTLSGDQMRLKKPLERIGLILEDRFLVGHSAKALRALRSHLKNSPPEPGAHSLCELSTTQQIAEILRIKKVVFRKQPQFG